ncbi:MAG: serine/threonine protein kinase, partial [Myxococcales bacterium]|nr:serine/threonine protein kinase [Myxococcales bacterium]
MPTRAGWPADELIGQIVGGRYMLIRRLGSGGFGVVYLAEHTQFNAMRAVKVLHSHLTYNHTVVERFKREARAIYRLSSPYIVRVEDFG